MGMRPREGEKQEIENGVNKRKGNEVARECTFQDFLKCKPHNFSGTEGVDSALTWWNSHKRTVGVEAAYTMNWVELMIDNRSVIELILLYTRMVPDEEDRVERFIGGLPDNIQGNVIAANPARLQDGKPLQNQLMEQGKSRKFILPGNNEKRILLATTPFCNKCRMHHEGLCTMRCGNCKKVGHQTRDCRAAIALNTQRAPVGARDQEGTLFVYECGRQTFRKLAPKLRKSDRGNQPIARIKNGNKTGKPDWKVTRPYGGWGGGGWWGTKGTKERVRGVRRVTQLVEEEQTLIPTLSRSTSLRPRRPEDKSERESDLEDVPIVTGISGSLSKRYWPGITARELQVEFQIDFSPWMPAHFSTSTVSISTTENARVCLLSYKTLSDKGLYKTRVPHLGDHRFLFVKKKDLVLFDLIYAKFSNVNLAVEDLDKSLTQKSVKFEWGEKAEAAFQLLKQKLCSAQRFLVFTRGMRTYVVYCPMLRIKVGPLVSTIAREKGHRLTHSRQHKVPSALVTDLRVFNTTRLKGAEYEAKTLAECPESKDKNQAHFLTSSSLGLMTIGYKPSRSRILSAQSKPERKRTSSTEDLRRKCMADEPLAIPLDEIQVDDKLNFIEEPVEIMDREVKRLKQSRIPIVKVRWNSRRGPEFTWEREDQMQKKYPNLFTNSATPLQMLRPKLWGQSSSNGERM
ncbi:putative reverse transcriptase domain-containing protein [Tanacetum coccineum]